MIYCITTINNFYFFLCKITGVKFLHQRRKILRQFYASGVKFYANFTPWRKILHFWRKNFTPSYLPPAHHRIAYPKFTFQSIIFTIHT